MTSALAFAPEIALYIYGDQWVPAVPALYVLSLNAVLVPISLLDRHPQTRYAPL